MSLRILGNEDIDTCLRVCTVIEKIGARKPFSQDSHSPVAVETMMSFHYLPANLVAAVGFDDFRHGRVSYPDISSYNNDIQRSFTLL